MCKTVDARVLPRPWYPTVFTVFFNAINSVKKNKQTEKLFSHKTVLNKAVKITLIKF